MRPVLLLLLAGGVMLAQQASPPVSPESSEEKPAPKTKARRLIDDSLETLSTATPAIQIAALLEIVQLYPEFDKAKTLELLDQAFAAAGAVPPEASRNITPASLQARVVFAAADVDIDKAIEMLPALPIDRRGGAVERIALALLAREDIDRAARLVEENPGQGYPPLRAIQRLLAVLPPDDPRRVTLFSNAFTQLDLRSSEVSFQDLLSKHWRTLPRPVVEAALTSLVNAILDRKDDDTSSTISLGTAKGTASFDDRKDYQLFDIIHVLQEFDPKRAADLLEKRPGLRENVARFPEGRKSMLASEKDGVSTSMRTRGKSDRPNPQADANMRLGALADSMSREILAQAQTDIQSAVSRVKEIPLDFMRVQTLAQIANLAAEKDPATARSVLGQAVAQLKDIKDPQLNAHAWAGIADAARRAKDDDLTRQAIDKGIEVCAALYKLDTDAESPNVAERERWPSVQHFRSILYRAAQFDGVNADTHLTRMTDPDLVLMGRIEIARALLGKPRSGTSISVSRRR